MLYSISLVAVLLAGSAKAHTWVEQLNVIASNGTMVGEPGFPRGNVLRSNSAFGDVQMTWLLPPNGRDTGNKILATDLMCKPSQTVGNQTGGSPALIASPGDMVALRYQENGHVTLPDAQAGKPANRGTIFIYGTTKPDNSDTLLAIHKVWNKDGTGGDKRGQLLATRNFDDGQCYQVNGGAISKTRVAQFKHDNVQPMGDNIWCQSDVTIPLTAPTSGSYSLYWVWEWPTAAGTPGFPNGLNETYTTCMDIEMKAVSGKNLASSENAGFKKGQDLNFAAVANQIDNPFQVTNGISGNAPVSAPTTAVATSSAPKSSNAAKPTQSPSIPGGSFQENPAAAAKATVTMSYPVTVHVTVTEKGAGASPTPTSTKVSLKTLSTLMMPSASPQSKVESSKLNIQPFTVTKMLPTETVSFADIDAKPTTLVSSTKRTSSSARSSNTVTKVETSTVTLYKTITGQASATLRGRIVKLTR